MIAGAEYFCTFAMAVIGQVGRVTKMTNNTGGISDDRVSDTDQTDSEYDANW